MVTTYQVASFRHHDVDVILIVVDPSVAALSGDEKKSLLRDLERRAHELGLPGRVALVWQTGNRIHAWGPSSWSGFLGSIDPLFLARSINRTLICR